ncbi:lysozyme inhibitor LprI family protein [Roseateles sp.]|jgi:uncharacterized protein YecT (DUF1311 family)|uniref:lysozyme inhibitor LprI family protein n=1 Tax=Roseateles sp. TaxID=1971397 RepID=UPI0037C5855F
MKILFVILMALVVTSAARAGDPCVTQANTSEVNQCAKQQFEQQDKLLNAAYQAALQVVPSANEPGTSGETPRALLVKAQRRWVEFRDADCKAKYQVFAGGTIRNVIYLGCMRERTEQRIKELAAGEWQGG